jgi:hypothetical protein
MWKLEKKCGNKKAPFHQKHASNLGYLDLEV